VAARSHHSWQQPAQTRSDTTPSDPVTRMTPALATNKMGIPPDTPAAVISQQYTGWLLAASPRHNPTLTPVTPSPRLKTQAPASPAESTQSMCFPRLAPALCCAPHRQNRVQAPSIAVTGQHPKHGAAAAAHPPSCGGCTLSCCSQLRGPLRPVSQPVKGHMRWGPAALPLALWLL
jgi:hypothetical protein